MIIAAAAVVAIAAAATFVALGQSGGRSQLPLQQEPVKSVSSGNFTVNVIEDSPTRFLAKVENKGPPLENTAAFLVKKGLNEKCAPKGIVVTNFKVGAQAGGKKPVPNPSSIPGHSTVTIDSREANLTQNPTGSNLETTLYVLKLQPGSIQATDLVEKVAIQQQNATDLELFEGCLAATGAKGYPLLLKILNAQAGTQSYFTISAGNDLSSFGVTYETALAINPGAQVPPELYWPASDEGWLSANFTKLSGPAPAWQQQDRPQSLMVTVKAVSDDAPGMVVQFEKQIQLAELRAIPSLDFVDLAKGRAVPLYPKYWEVVIDLQNKSIS